MLSRMFIALIYCYRWCISPLFAQRCRFYPSCSQYALDALQSHSLPRAAWLIVARVGRCHPWHPGGYDPVPQCTCDDSSHEHSTLSQPLLSRPNEVSTRLHKTPSHQ